MLHTGAVLHGTRCQPEGLPAQEWYTGLGYSPWLQEWAVSNVKCNHIALICFPTVLFWSNSVLASGVVLRCYAAPWRGTPACSDGLSARGSPECVAEIPVTTERDLGSNQYIPLILLPAILQHTLESLWVISHEGMMQIYTFFFFFWSSWKPSLNLSLMWTFPSGLLKKRKEQFM